MEFNLTHPQKRIWYTEKIHANSAIHNIGGCLQMKGKINIELLEQAIHTVIENNEGMRLRFSERLGEPYQYVSEYRRSKIDFIDFSICNQPLIACEDWVQETFQKAFQLENSDLYYIAIYKIVENEYGLLFNIHHIISDGWSTKLIQNQVCDLYTNLLEDKEAEPVEKYSYIEYIKKEKEYFRSDRFLKSKFFWDSKFSDLSEAFLYKSISDTESRRKSFQLDHQMSLEIRRFTQEHRVSLNTFFIAVMMIYYYKVLDQEDIVLGTPVLNRTGKMDKNTIGMYTSTVPVRVKINPKLTIKELLKEVLLELKHCLLHQKYPYDLLISDLELNKKGYDSLFKVCVNYYNTQYIKEIGGVPAEVKEYNSGNQSNSMQLVVNEWQEDYINLSFDYKISDYQEEEITNMYAHIQNIVNQFLDNEDMIIEDVELYSEKEFHEKIYSANATQISYPDNKTIHQLFEEQVEKSPDQVALFSDGKTLTYRELNERANQLAFFLKEQGVTKEKIVAIKANHSLELVVAILAVLKAGGAYLPIDPNYPIERINFMLQDSGAVILLTDDELHHDLEFQGAFFDLHHEHIYAGNKTNVDCDQTSKDLAYIIYTSGSTGKPKGVMIEHRNLVHYIWWANKTYVKEQEVFALYSSISFDLTVTSIFTPLISGNQIAIYYDDDKEFILHKILRENKATIVKLTPAHLTLIKDMDNHHSSVKRMIVGGDNLKVAVAREVVESFNGDLEIYNEYGPTEATVGCMIYKYDVDKDRDGSVPIGVAIDNTQIYLLDKNLKPIATGLQGELYISGDGLARGYLNQTELTSERFIQNPFTPEMKMYKTGDIAKYLSDGNITYIGRSDHQVKIRGYRIELGEIEKHLLEHPFIHNIYVMDRENRTGDKLLYVYYVSEHSFSSPELKNWLSKYVPPYMVPNIFIRLDEIPLTINGKVNMALLPIEDDSDKTTTSTSASSNQEIELVNVMQEILGISEISMDDNFYQLGGDSIKAIQIASKLKNVDIDINVKDILSKESIEEIAATMSVRMERTIVDQDACKGVIEKTPIIEWFFAQKFKEMNHFNQSILLVCKNNIDKKHIQTAVEKLIEHHDIIRMTYDQNTGGLYYRNDFSADAHKVDYFDLSHLSSEDQYRQINELGYQVKASLALSIGPLFKAAIFNLGEVGQILLFTAHHLAVDGVSWRILIEDFSTIIQQLHDEKEIVLPLKTNSFADWSTELHEYSNQILQTEIDYWKELLTKDAYFPAECDLGADDITSASVVRVELDEQLLHEFTQEINEIYGLTLHEGLIIALLLTIHQETSQAEIMIELEGHGREMIHKEIDVSRTVGWFTSMYPAYFTIQNEGMDYRIKHLKEQLRSIPNKGFHYGILQYLKKEFTSETQKGVRFNYLGNFDNSLNSDVFHLSPIDCGVNIGYDNHLTALLDMTAMIVNQNFRVEITYSQNRYHTETMQSFLNNYMETVKEIVRFCTDKNEKEFTPSDFNLDLSQDDLDSLFDIGEE
ncbi:amino acid adenylation domain-containing protein [Bacillus wiedmannii]|uniref:amino acid adenylation domain-containing protein n=1 Tax=Bacillus wiedmannii TaxID=1890302 RepID=UPI002E1E924C|nr:amino acid adenylation domain-containing protein [Bacillus wiedmannii]